MKEKKKKKTRFKGVKSLTVKKNRQSKSSKRGDKRKIKPWYKIFIQD